MQTTCIESFRLEDISKVWPIVREFDSIRMDGIIRRPHIKAVVDDDKGLRFEIPTPERYGKTVGDAWQRAAYAVQTDGPKALPGPGDEFPDMPTLPRNGDIQLDYTEHALRQISELCGVGFQDLQKEADRFPDIAARRINAWLQDEPTINRKRKRPIPANQVEHLVRAYAVNPGLLLNKGVDTGVLRAIRSSQFQLGMDAGVLLAALLKCLSENQDTWGQCKVEVSVSDRGCHFCVTNKRMTAATRTGDIIAASVAGRTSDIGGSALVIEQRYLKLACINGMIADQVMSQRHLGAKPQTRDGFQFSDATLMAQGGALLLEMQDAINFCFQQESLDRVAAKMGANQNVEVSPEEAQAVFDTVTQVLGVPDSMKDDIFAQFLGEQKADGSENRTQDGVVQAITATGRVIGTSRDFAEALPFESLGGTLHQMEEARFRNLTKAAVNGQLKKAKSILAASAN